VEGIDMSYADQKGVIGTDFEVILMGKRASLSEDYIDSDTTAMGLDQQLPVEVNCPPMHVKICIEYHI
jgi:hypothetical protein